MSAVERLVTLVDVVDDTGRSVSFSARHEAVLADGRRVLLLDDRGWTESGPGGYSREDVERTARTVVGPDEPFEGRSQADMEADHWACLAGVLRRHGLVVDAEGLKRLPHDVVLGRRLRARVGRG